MVWLVEEREWKNFDADTVHFANGAMSSKFMNQFDRCLVLFTYDSAMVHINHRAFIWCIHVHVCVCGHSIKALIDNKI